MASRCQFENSNDVGVFANLTSSYCITALGAAENFYRQGPSSHAWAPISLAPRIEQLQYASGRCLSRPEGAGSWVAASCRALPPLPAARRQVHTGSRPF